MSDHDALTAGDLRRALENLPDDVPVRLAAADDTGSDDLVAIEAACHRLTIESIDHGGTYQGAEHLRIWFRPATFQETRVVYRAEGHDSP